MRLKWIAPWKDVVDAAYQILSLCEPRLRLLLFEQQEVSRTVLKRVRLDLRGDLTEIQREPHQWATKLANVAVRIAKRIPKNTVADRQVAIKLAIFCGMVYQYQRTLDPARYENPFRDSLEVFLQGSLPELAPTTISADVLEEVTEWLKGFYGSVPQDVNYLVNDIVLSVFEERRKELDRPETRGLMVRFIEDNKDLINLPVSEASEWIRKKWETLYKGHVGSSPTANEEALVTTEIRACLKGAIKENDPMTVRDVLAPMEQSLIETVRAALHVSFEFREPQRVVRDRSGIATGEFEAARRQIRRNNKGAVATFRRVWQEQPQDYYAKEWFAYVRAKIDEGYQQAKPLFEDIRQAGRGDEITDWNLACCEIMSADKKSAFEILRQRIETGKNIDVVLEPAIALALDLHEKRFLAGYLDWLPHEESILLAYLFAADSGDSSEELEKRLATIDVIASHNTRFKPPDPAERLTERQLNDLGFAFIERRMLHGGIYWFRRRLSFEEHKWFYLNWRLLGDLYIQVRQYDQAASAYDSLLNATKNSRARLEIKQATLEYVLTILFDRGLIKEGASVIEKYGREILSGDELERWQDKLRETQIQYQAESKIDDSVTPKPKSFQGTPAIDTETTQTAISAPSKFMQVTARLPRVRRLRDLNGDFTLLTDGAECLHTMWPAHSRKLVEHLRLIVQCLQRFTSTGSLEEKQDLASMLREKMAEGKVILKETTDPTLKEQADSLISALERLAADASFQTNAVRTLSIDWRMNGYLPDRTLAPASPDLPRTSLLLRLLNTGTNPATDVVVHLQSESGKTTVVENVQKVNVPLGVGESAVVRFSLEYESLSGEETFLTYTMFTSGGISDLQTPSARFSIRAESFSKRVGGDVIQDSFFVGVGIPENRRDIFHGRQKEQERVGKSLKGDVQSEVLFLNGPRRVGKTSILNSLKWALPELGLKEVIVVSLPEVIPETTAAFLLGIADDIIKAVHSHLSVDHYLSVQSRDEFYREPITAFRNFCEIARKQLHPRKLLLMIDETQRLAQAVKDGRIDDNVLSLFSTLMSRASGVYFIFTASVLFRNIKEMSNNPIWGRLMQFATGFLRSDAVDELLRAGVAGYPVLFTPEALKHVWETTEGHPWIVQAIGKRIVTEVLNPQQRLAVGPPDVDQAIGFIEKHEDQYSDLWWNEKENEGGFIDDVDWQIAKVVIEEQSAQGVGIPKSALVDRMSQKGKPVTNERINKLVDMQTMVKETRDGVEYVRIKGLFLERWLSGHDKVQHSSSERQGRPVRPNVALFVDHENVSISMRKYIEQLPITEQTGWASVREPLILARRLAQHAERFGTVVPPRYAVANWELFSRDISAYAQAMFEISQPLGGKNTSDERLKQLIRDTLEQKPEVDTYILATGDSDFRDTIQTLLKRNKAVILWGFRAIGSIHSNIHSIFRQMEQWQNLTIEYLDDILRQEPPRKSVAVGENVHA